MRESHIWLLLVVFCWGIAVYGLQSGRMPDKSAWLYKSESPTGFWLYMVMWIAFGFYSVYRWSH